MQIKFTRVKSEMRRIRTGLNKAVVRKANTIMRQATIAALRQFMASSPVWSGELVRNYRVAIGRTPTGFVNPVGGAYTWDGSGSSEGDDDLRNEVRRPGNEAAALAEARGVLASTNQGKELTRTINIKNTVDMNKAALAEAGALPTKAKSRYSGGITAKATVAALRVSKGLLK